MTATTLAADGIASYQSVLFIVAPLLGGVMLAYGVFQVALDLRANTRKRVMDRLKGDRFRGQPKATAGFDDFRRQTVEATGILARAFTKFSFTERFQRVLRDANRRPTAKGLVIQADRAIRQSVERHSGS